MVWVSVSGVIGVGGWVSVFNLEDPKDLNDPKDLKDSIRFELLIFGLVARHCRHELAIFEPMAHNFCLAL